MVPERSIEVATLTNGGVAGQLNGDLSEPLLEELAGIARYVGRYRTRTDLYALTVEDDGQTSRRVSL